MYISHKYKLIFLRTPKTASSSLSEFFIRNIPDPDAVYGPVEDAKIKGNIPHIVNKYRKNFKYYHFTLEELVQENLVTPEQARTYKVISVIREPLDRHKSHFYFYSRWKARGRPLTLDVYKSLAPTGHFTNEPNSSMLQSKFCKFEGVDRGSYWLYENLANHVDDLMKELGLTIVHDIPRHKTDFRKNRDNEIVFDDDALGKIKDIFGPDFELYNRLKAEQNGDTN